MDNIELSKTNYPAKRQKLIADINFKCQLCLVIIPDECTYHYTYHSCRHIVCRTCFEEHKPNCPISTCQNAKGDFLKVIFDTKSTAFANYCEIQDQELEKVEKFRNSLLEKIPTSRWPVELETFERQGEFKFEDLSSIKPISILSSADCKNAIHYGVCAFDATSMSKSSNEYYVASVISHFGCVQSPNPHVYSTLSLNRFSNESTKLERNFILSHSDIVTDIQFGSEKHEYLLTCGYDSKIVLYDFRVANQVAIDTFQNVSRNKNKYTCLCWDICNDNNKFLAGTKTGLVNVFDLRSSKKEFDNHPSTLGNSRVLRISHHSTNSKDNREKNFHDEMNCPHYIIFQTKGMSMLSGNGNCYLNVMQGNNIYDGWY
jgi:WD40 repeat protein